MSKPQKGKPARLPNRKQRRKQERKEKKARKGAFNVKKYGKEILNDEEIAIETSNVAVLNPKKEKPKADSATRMRRIQLKEANKEEDKNIRILGKKLGIKKRKNKNLFANDGLGYILEVLDKPDDTNNANFNLSDADSDINEDLNNALGKTKKEPKAKISSKKVSKNNTIIASILSENSDQESSENSDQEISDFSNQESNDSSDGESDGEGKDFFVKSPVDAKIIKTKTNYKSLAIITDKNENISNGSDNSSDENSKQCIKSQAKIKNKNIASKEKAEFKKSVTWSDSKEIKSNLKRKLSASSESSEDEAFGESDVELSDPENEIETENEYWEDIYGRTRDKEGNVIPTTNQEKMSSKYIPPAKRAQLSTDQSKEKKQELLLIKRQIKGLLNRVSESNMKFIADQIEDMYMRHSRNDMNQSLTRLVLESVVSTALTPERLIMEHSLLLSLLHANVGTEIGAHCLQTFATEFHQKFESKGNYGQGKESDNLLMLICHLYTFKVTHNTLIFDIIKLLADTFSEKDVELILLILRSIGFGLRKDNPNALKEIILNLQSKASATTHSVDESRVRFMIETLMAIRNNNMHKIPNYDPSLAEHMRKVLRGLQRKGAYIQELQINFSDLLQANEKGRWWIVGSAWQGNQDSEKDDTPTNLVTTKQAVSQVSQQIIELARKQRMSTESRKNIFCILMSAEDYMDAFEKILHLRLKNQQEREIIHVIMDCCLQEKEFNPYYAFIAEKFCHFDRRFQMTLQFALWDKFKEIKELRSNQLSNLAQLISHQLIKSSLPLSILKVIELSEMDKSLVKFLRQTMLAVLLNDSEDVCINVFARITAAPNLHMFREGLRLFMHHFLLKNQEKLEPETAAKLRERVEMVENVLTAAERRR